MPPNMEIEFKQILDDVKDCGPLLKKLRELDTQEGGLLKLKDVVGLITAEQRKVDEIKGLLDKLQKMLPKARSSGLVGTRVSPECARYIGALILGIGVKRGQVTGRQADMVEGIFKELMGAEVKTALTSSDIPLPTEYGSQVVELVGLYGMARRYGTVFPLGAGTVKLPYLSTDTTFGLLTIATAVTEKSPAFSNVTFTPEKFGGLIRIPTELDEDSIVALGQFVARYASRNIARAEDYNFFASTGAGSGVNGSVEGLTTSVITNAKVVQMAATKTKYSDATLSYLRQIRGKVDAAALRMGAYYFHPTFEQLLSTFNTAGDRPYNPNAQLTNAGAQPFVNGPTLDGFPVRWVDVLPTYDTSAHASAVCALFGDLEFQYLGVRGGVRFDTSTEAAFATDEILVRAIERFTIGLMATGAVSGLETAAA